MSNNTEIKEHTRERIMDILEGIEDPEIPVISITELGIVREVEKRDGNWIITITPTYSGCPAMNMIEMQIRMELDKAGLDNYELKTSLTPPWTTDWITEGAKKKLKAFGIAPPAGTAKRIEAIMEEDLEIPCPHCGSTHTKLVSQFGSTPCKAMYKCEDCLEPFDYFKCH